MTWGTSLGRLTVCKLLFRYSASVPQEAARLSLCTLHFLSQTENIQSCGRELCQGCWLKEQFE